MEKYRRLKSETASREADSPSSGLGPDKVETPGSVEVIWGFVPEQHFDIQGLTVGEAFDLLRGPLNIAPGVVATINRNPAQADDRLAANDTLEFVKAAGEKGAAA